MFCPDLCDIDTNYYNHLFPVLFGPFKYIFYRLAFIEPPRNFYIISRFTL